jgi:hypothetical protein
MVVSMLSRHLRTKMEELHWKGVAEYCGFENVHDWEGNLKPDYGELPRKPLDRFTVYRATPETYGYNHGPSICRLQDRYIAVWSSCRRHEGYRDQITTWSFSEDGKKWSKPQSLAWNNPEDPWRRGGGGLYASERKAVAYVNTRNPEEKAGWVDVFVTEDGRNWEEHPKLVEDVGFNEGPRITSSGRLFTTGGRGRVPVAVLFEGADPLSRPRTVDIPLPDTYYGLCPPPDLAPSHLGSPPPPSPPGIHVGEPVLCEPSWYQTDDGRIWMFLRDQTLSCCLYLSYSDDEGETWSVASRTDFPDCTSKFHAGRLPDGRFYIVGNSTYYLMNRKVLILSTSDDGKTFDKMFMLADNPPKRRIDGYHKERGYQYPNTFIEDNRMYIIYSVNKEDIEVGILNLDSI